MNSLRLVDASPTVNDDAPFNPLSKASLADSVMLALSRRIAIPLSPSLPMFNGPGLYAIYYTGDFDAYAPLVASNGDGKFLYPIYVGKADPPGKRKGVGSGDDDDKRPLRGRLMKHRRGLGKVQPSLCVDDFFAKYLVVDEGFIGLCETLLIARFTPLWNSTVDGFGINQPGSGREKQVKSRWDTLHPGRTEARNLPDRQESVEIIKQEIAQHFRDHPLVGDDRTQP